MSDHESSPSDTMGFSLVDEPWIAVRLVDGTNTQFSLRETFHRAGDIRDLCGEVATQDFAVLRLLLAIVYRTVNADVTPDRWEQWHLHGLPLAEIDAYLNRYADRFDLFDAERPFFQVADLATAKGEMKDVAPLIFDLPNNNRLFTTRAGTGAVNLNFAEAARWLVNAQAFDASGIKTGALGDDRVKGGRGYPIGVAWSGLLGGLYAVGETLRETLLLNLVGTSNEFPLDSEDLPPWEDPQPDTAAERIDLSPRGPVRLYTWQSRRIRLFRRDDRVVGCLLANGDKLTPQNMQLREPMSGWRFSEPQTKSAGHTVYMPREHVAGRALWRGISALLPGIADVVPKRDVPASLPPALVLWLERLRSFDILSASDTVRLRAVGVVYGSNNSVVDEILVDELLLPLTVLGQGNRALAIEAQNAVRAADEGARIVRQFAENIARAAGGDAETRGDQARDRAYALLDAPYREWLADLAENPSPLDAQDAWKDQARRVLLALGDELLETAPTAAWRGRDVHRLGTTTFINASRAEAWFLAGLRKTLGTHPQENEAA